jgi:nudix-type nucleoside diphosphatase (YffH/AdpP family)
MGRGADVPDGRGRTGLDRVGRDLTGNPDVVVRDVEVTSDGWHVLRRTTYDRRRSDGTWTTESRETYDRGNGATVLLHDPDRATVLLTRQFRFPAYVNGHPDGVLLEAAAGLLDADDPETAARRETEEELGVRIRGPLVQAFDAFMSPGSVTERLHCYVGRYSPADRVHDGGGVAAEGEDIEVVELPLAQALGMVDDGRIRDGKTIMLLQWLALRERAHRG